MILARADQDDPAEAVVVFAGTVNLMSARDHALKKTNDSPNLALTDQPLQATPWRQVMTR